MGWKERAEAYRKAGAEGRMADDDAVARQILKGLGWDIRKIHLLASILGIPVEQDDPLLDIASRILGAVSGGTLGQGGSPDCRYMLYRAKVGSLRAWYKSATAGKVADLAAARPVTGGIIVPVRSPPPHLAVGLVLLHDKGASHNIPEWLLSVPSSLVYQWPDKGVALWIRPLAPMVEAMARVSGWDIPEGRDNG